MNSPIPGHLAGKKNSCLLGESNLSVNVVSSPSNHIFSTVIALV